MADSILSQRFGSNGGNELDWLKFDPDKSFQFDFYAPGIFYVSVTLWGNAGLSVDFFDTNDEWIGCFSSNSGNNIDWFNIYGSNGIWSAYIFLIEVLPGSPWKCRTIRFTNSDPEIEVYDGVSYATTPDAYISQYTFIPYS